MLISTWIHCDEEHEESRYPQVGDKSSSRKFQEVYWKCVTTFFATSRRMNPGAKHVLFTNVARIPSVGGFDLESFLRNRLDVEVRTLPLTYRVPDGYYGSWKNQFYLFDILKDIAASGADDGEKHIVMDSDCVWLKSADPIERLLERHGLLTMTADVDDEPEYVMNGLSRYQMGRIYEEMLGVRVEEPPPYYGGEWFAATAREVRRVIREIDHVWQDSMKRFAEGRDKFNEEAQMLSFVYYKLGYPARTANPYIRRIWTPLGGISNASIRDLELAIWHLPSEKKLGLSRMFAHVVRPDSPFWKSRSDSDYAAYLARKLGIPRRSGAKLLLDAQNLVFQKMFRLYT